MDSVKVQKLEAEQEPDLVLDSCRVRSEPGRLNVTEPTAPPAGRCGS